MYEMGEQIGLSTKILHARAKTTPDNTWVYAVAISATAVLVALTGFVWFKRSKKASLAELEKRFNPSCQISEGAV